MANSFQRIGLVVLVVLATSGVWQAAAQVEAKRERPKWEYTWVGEGPGSRQMGDEGWELVAVSSRGSSDTLYFKRQK